MKHLKNHKVIGQIRNEQQLILYLRDNVIIYFAPCGRVLPTAFFKGFLWSSTDKLWDYVRNGDFWIVERNEVREKRRKNRIRKSIDFVNGSKIFFDKNTSKVKGMKPISEIYVNQ